jgi:hypothetical protein
MAEARIECRNEYEVVERAETNRGHYGWVEIRVCCPSFPWRENAESPYSIFPDSPSRHTAVIMLDSSLGEAFR